MKGRRLPDDYPRNNPNFQWHEVQPGDYWKNSSDGTWFVSAPNGGGFDGDAGTVGPPTWTVTEHEDGTITVQPSIWFNKPHGWHGFLERGVWRQV